MSDDTPMTYPLDVTRNRITYSIRGRTLLRVTSSGPATTFEPGIRDARFLAAVGLVNIKAGRTDEWRRYDAAYHTRRPVQLALRVARMIQVPA